MKRDILFCILVSIGAYYLMPCAQAQAPIQAPPQIQVSQASAQTPAKTKTKAKAKSSAPTQAKTVKKPAPILTEKEQRAAHLASKGTNIDPDIVELALTAHEQAKARGLVNKPLLTLIDYSKPSVEKRLWVFDLDKNELLMEAHVTHGEGSGKDRARRFSNEEGSHKSSIGVFTTAETYRGAFGYSLRLDGHEIGFNDRARERFIVMHGADYASERYIKKNGTLGTSWACPAVDSKIAAKLIDMIKEGSLIVAYYPDRKWLRSSSFLNLE